MRAAPRGGVRKRGLYLGKLIARTAGITLACLFALILIVFGVLTVFFPSAMLAITDACGMDKACAQYAVAVYTRSNEIDDLADAVERAYYAESWDIAADYGERLMAREDFSEFCKERDAKDSTGNTAAGYAQYTAGMVAVSQYNMDKEDDALETAFLYNTASFTENNAAVSLAMTAMQEGDQEFAARILQELRTVTGNINLDMESDIANLETLISILESFCAQPAQ